MKWRTILAVAGSAVLLNFGGALADSFPTRPVTVIVPAAAGGGTDVSARIMAELLAAKWGSSVVVENRPGVGVIGATSVAKAAPDGHTLLMATSGTLFSIVLHRKPPFDIENDLVPVSYVADTPFVLVASPTLPVKDVRGLIAHARSKPGQLTYGTAGAGSLQHLAAEVFNEMAGTKMTAVPYRGSTPALQDVMSSRTDMMFLPLGSALPQIAAGKVRAIGVASSERIASAPDIPALAEGLPGYSATSWQLVAVTGGSPKIAVEKLNKDIYAALADPKFQALMRKQNLIAKSPKTIAENQAFVRSEIKKWMPVMERLGLRK